MGQFSQSNEATVEVVAAAGFRVTLSPLVVQVNQGDLDMVARFKVGIVRDAGYTKPVYLLTAGTSIGEFFLVGTPITVPDKDYALVPAAINEVDLEMDMTGADVISMPFSVMGTEDEPIPEP